MKQQNFLGTILMLVFAPVIYIAAFNAYFGTSIPWTFESWLLAFIVGVVAALVFIGAFLIGLLGGVALFKGPGVLVAIGTLFALPLIYIYAFNLVMRTEVPYSGQSYLFVGAVLFAVAVLSGLLRRVLHR